MNTKDVRHLLFLNNLLILSFCCHHKVIRIVFSISFLIFVAANFKRIWRILGKF